MTDAIIDLSPVDLAWGYSLILLGTAVLRELGTFAPAPLNEPNHASISAQSEQKVVTV